MEAGPAARQSSVAGWLAPLPMRHRSRSRVALGALWRQRCQMMRVELRAQFLLLQRAWWDGTLRSKSLSSTSMVQMSS